jgi:hypothetical protein
MRDGTFFCLTNSRSNLLPARFRDQKLLSVNHNKLAVLPRASVLANS